MWIEKKDIIRCVTWGVLIPMFLVGCSFEDDLADSGGLSASDEGQRTYISLTFNVPSSSSTRTGGGSWSTSSNRDISSNGGGSMNGGTTGGGSSNVGGSWYGGNSSNRGSSTIGGTRSGGPTGGEEGDGREKGAEDEYKVSSAAIFLYKDADGKGVNGDGTNPVTLITLGEDSLTNNAQAADIYWKYENKITTVAFSVPTDEFPDTVYRMIVETNPKDLGWAENAANLTLGDVRDHVETQAWDTLKNDDGTIKKYSSFLMTSENDNNTLELNHNDSESNPATATIDVERMAAQVVYQANGMFTINSNDETYGGDATYNGATVTINSAVLINNLTSGSYLLKRVTDGVSSKDITENSTYTYLGKETDNGSGVATNYVLDPWTTLKNGTDVDNINDATNGKLTYGIYYPGIATEEQQDPAYWDAIMKEGNPITSMGDTWYSVGYTMENTTFASNTNKKYATGMVFQAQFTPADESVSSPYYNKITLTTGETFFKWDDVLYATAEDMMQQAYSNPFNVYNKFADKIDERSTWEDVAEFADSLIKVCKNDPTGYTDYLLAKVDSAKNSKTYNETLTETDYDILYWEKYMSDQFGYEVSESTDESSGETVYTVAITTDGVKALNDATDGKVQAFRNGLCYYTWWIRHSDDNDEANNGVMEYAIVRNNIYYLRVKSVYTLGGYIPTEGLQCEVYVKLWNVLEDEIVNI